MWNAPKDYQTEYVNFVRQCLTDEDAFNKFKSVNAYNTIVGMSLPWQSQLFYDKIKQYPEIYSKLIEFCRNDSIGNPELSLVDGKRISPNTLRHVHTLCDLYKHFGNLDDKIISELGVGYGATAFMVNTYYKPNTYYLIDLPDVQKFAAKYLSKFGINVSIESPPASVDLFISEFCISEFDDEELYRFYDLYVRNAKNAYLMMNLHDETRKQKFINHMNLDFNISIFPEYPATHWPNYLIIGKQ